MDLQMTSRAIISIFGRLPTHPWRKVSVFGFGFIGVMPFRFYWPVETFTGPEYLQAPSSPREPTRRVLYSINVPARKHGARRAYDGCQL
jgi:hypothetical protein